METGKWGKLKGEACSLWLVACGLRPVAWGLFYPQLLSKFGMEITLLLPGMFTLITAMCLYLSWFNN
jgi:hypothetical protein